MNIETRKEEFVQEFLKLKNEEVVSKFERMLKKVKKTYESCNDAMTKEELNNRVRQSELDFENGNYKNSSELLEKYK